MSACGIIANYLEKSGGEGSRGGHVIGHTKRGNKPIYSKGGEHHGKLASAGSFRATPEDIKAAADSFPGWTATDHAQARDALRRHGDALERQAESAAFSTGGQLTPRYHQHMSESGATSAAASGHAEIAKYKRANKKVGKSMGGLTSPHKEGIMQACDIIKEYLGKAGAGSRGGKVLKYLANGKAVYQHKSASDPAYTHFTAQDHEEAMKVHQAESKKQHDKSTNFLTHTSEVGGAERASEKHRMAASSHHVAAGRMSQAAKKSLGANDGSASDILGAYVSDLNKGGGEGSRGGKIIGHSANGSPIYASHSAKNKAYANFSADDHHAAMDAHVSEMARHLRSDSSLAAKHKNRAMQHAIAATQQKGGSKLPPASSVGRTESGKHIHSADSKKHYGKVSDRDRTKDWQGQEDDDRANAKHVKASYPDFTDLDHIDAAKLHEDTNNHDVAGAHFAAAGWHDKGRPEHKSRLAEHYRKSDVVVNDFSKSDWSASDILGAYVSDLSKGGGEGSRGGRIIGHTASGPVYAHQKASSAHYSKFKAKDHGKAGEAHSVEAHRYRGLALNSKGEDAHHWTDMQAHHEKKADDHFKKEHSLSKSDGDGDCGLSKGGGEGSRGGKIIGHTASGPVYAGRQAGHKAYAKFSAKDHGDAADAHYALSTRHFHMMRAAEDARDESARVSHRDASIAHSDLAAGHQGRKSNTSKSLLKSDGDGDHGHEFADTNNLNPDMPLVRQVSDVTQSPLNDAIAASWPGMAHMAHSTQNFCNMANSYTQGE